MNNYFHKFLRAALMAALAGVALGNLTARERWHVYDALGNTVASVNADAIVAAVESTAFGESRTPTAGERFTGKPYDADLGAHVFPFRNYRSDAARWISADPSGFPDGSNQISYAPVPTLGVDIYGLAYFEILLNELSYHGASGKYEGQVEYEFDGNSHELTTRPDSLADNPGFTGNIGGSYTYMLGGSSYTVTWSVGVADSSEKKTKKELIGGVEVTLYQWVAIADVWLKRTVKGPDGNSSTTVVDSKRHTKEGEWYE